MTGFITEVTDFNQYSVMNTADLEPVWVSFLVFVWDFDGIDDDVFESIKSRRKWKPFQSIFSDVY